MLHFFLKLGVGVSFLVFGLSFSATAVPLINYIRTVDYINKTRLEIEFNQPTKFRYFLFSRPHRIVFDFPDVEWRFRSKENLVSKRIKGYRLSFPRRSHSRITLNVSRSFKIAKIFTEVPEKGSGFRILMDLVNAPNRKTKNIYNYEKMHKRLGKFAPLPPRRKPKSFKRPLILLDPGHGGVDPGARGKNGRFEKSLVLSYAIELRRQLLKTGRYKVILTRYNDVFVSLRKRIAIAQAAKADLFISLHADSIADRNVRGGSVYTLSKTASDKEAAALARRENKSDLILGFNLNKENKSVAKVLIDISQNYTKNESIKFAKILVSSLGKRIRMLRKPLRSAGFTVLKAPAIPSVLLELGYLSNRIDERLLRSFKQRRIISNLIVKAISIYFSTNKLFVGHKSAKFRF